MGDFVFSRTLFIVGETPNFIPGNINGIEFFVGLELTTFYREIIIIS
jgi:hypothetical protein